VGGKKSERDLLVLPPLRIIDSSFDLCAIFFAVKQSKNWEK